MGSRLHAQAAIYALPRLDSHPARVVLQLMTLHALDTDKEPAYFAGSANLARCLGYPAGSSAGKRAVERAIAELVGHGMIQQAAGYPRRYKRRWMLRLPGPTSCHEAPAVSPTDTTMASPQGADSGVA